MIMRRKDEDPLVGALPKPTQNVTGSPALAGQPASITGAEGMPPEMPRTGSAGGGPALAPTPAPGGTAEVGGAPLSIDGATEQAAGVGGQPNQFSNLDLVKDRGTPDQYWQETINKIGSRDALSMMGDAANAASHRTGEQAMMDQETVRRDGVRVNEAMGMGNDPDVQDATIEQMVYGPMSSILKTERDTGTIDPGEADFRLMTTMAQVEGPETEDELKEIFVSATKRMSEETEEAEPVMEQAEAESPVEELEEFETEMPPEGAAEGVQEEEVGEGTRDDTQKAEIPKEKEGLWKRFKNWWKLGTEDVTESYWADPETGEEVEKGTEGAVQKERVVTAAEDIEVTKFMGGMTRQELGMFVFQWGALMMANSEEGFGGAMGLAGAGAMSGHLERQAQAGALEGEAADRALRERQVAAAEYDTKVGENDELLERVRQEDGSFRWEPVKGEDGKIIKVKDKGDDPYQGLAAWEAERWERLGYSEAVVAEIQQGGMAPSAVYDRMYDDLLTRKGKALEEEKMNLPDNMRQKIENLDGQMVPLGSVSNTELAQIARRDAEAALEQRSALRPGRRTTDEEADEYYRNAQ